MRFAAPIPKPELFHFLTAISVAPSTIPAKAITNLAARFKVAESSLFALVQIAMKGGCFGKN